MGGLIEILFRTPKNCYEKLVLIPEIKDVLVITLPVGPRTHSLFMDRRSATYQKILPLILMATTFIQLSQNRHRYNRQASGGVYSNGNIEEQHKVDHPYYTRKHHCDEYKIRFQS